MLERPLLEVSVICLAELKKRQYGRKISCDGVRVFGIMHLLVLPVCLKALLQRPEAVNSLFQPAPPRLLKLSQQLSTPARASLGFGEYSAHTCLWGERSEPSAQREGRVYLSKVRPWYMGG